MQALLAVWRAAVGSIQPQESNLTMRSSSITQSARGQDTTYLVLHGTKSPALWMFQNPLFGFSALTRF